MDKNRLNESLNELQEALQNSTTISSADRKRLERLEASIQKRLEQEEPAGEEDEGLANELMDAIQEFEVTHPQITLALGHLMDILSQSGV